jgi:DNA-binding transcriptional regulator of glucitol operon
MPDPVQTLVILFGLLGLAAAAFHWGSSSLYIDAKQAVAEWLIGLNVIWPLQAAAPWWILTNYPDQNDVMTLLDGTILLGYLTVFAAVIGSFLGGCAALSTLALGRWSWPRFHHLVQSLIPLAGCGVFLGLSMTTVTLLRHDGFDLNFIGALRALMLGGAAAWSLWLGFRIARLYSADASRRLMAMLPLIAAVGTSGAVWATLFW